MAILPRKRGPRRAALVRAPGPPRATRRPFVQPDAHPAFAVEIAMPQGIPDRLDHRLLLTIHA